MKMRIHFIVAILLFLQNRVDAQIVSYTDLYDNTTFARNIADLTSKPAGTIQGDAVISPGGQQ